MSRNKFAHLHKNVVKYKYKIVFAEGGNIMEFKELIKERRSVRGYEACDIDDAVLREIIEDALQAPSWKNSQTARYYVANTAERMEAVREALPAFNQNSSENAALIVTTYVRETSGFTAGNPDNELGNKWGAYDLGLANAYLVLSAKDKGYDSLIMGIRDAAVIRKTLNVPKNEQIVSIIAIGKGAKEPRIQERKSVDDVTKF